MHSRFIPFCPNRFIHSTTRSHGLICVYMAPDCPAYVDLKTSSYPLFAKTWTFSIASCHTPWPLMGLNYIHSWGPFVNNAGRRPWWALLKEQRVGVPLGGGREGCHMVYDPSCLAACFLWFFSAGHPLMPGGAIDGAASSLADIYAESDIDLGLVHDLS